MSRSVGRARGWGIPVPDDPTQVVYVWFDALTNYISALGYGDVDVGGGGGGGGRELYGRWWEHADERIHVVGEGITRFHAVYWPAFLLSAGEPVPTRIQVHPYLSLEGAKLSKSGSGLSPTRLTDEYGADALRWWISSDVNATSDTDFTIDRLVTRANETLANGFGNALSRVTTLRHRHRHHDRAVQPRQSPPTAVSADLETDVASPPSPTSIGAAPPNTSSTPSRPSTRTSKPPNRGGSPASPTPPRHSPICSRATRPACATSLTHSRPSPRNSLGEPSNNSAPTRQFHLSPSSLGSTSGTKHRPRRLVPSSPDNPRASP